MSTWGDELIELHHQDREPEPLAFDQREAVFRTVLDVLHDSGIEQPRASELAEKIYRELGRVL